MYLSITQTLVIIISVAIGTIITRFTPFILFPEKKKPPKIITYLGNVLPAATMGLLVVYCLRNTTIIKYPYGLPELIALVCVVVLHKLMDNVLISIGGGTIIYMVLVQLVFA